MVQRVTGRLPDWARRDHPVLRYEMGRRPPASRSTRLLRALVNIVVLGVLGLIGVMVATNFGSQPAGQNPTDSLNNLLYIPLLAIQAILSVAALTQTAGAVGEEIRRQNWDNLRATPNGAELMMRARWASVFYRLQPALGLLLFMRVVLIAAMLWDLTAFQGRYLDLLINGITPSISLAVAVMLLSFLMTAVVLLPLTAIGFDAAFGLLIAATFPGRMLNTLAQALYILVRLGLIIGLGVLARAYMEGRLAGVGDGGGWAVVAINGAVGDWGLSFLYLGRYGEIWATIPYGVFMGLALMLFSLIQAALADVVLILAVRQGQRKG
jgi:hypothetical protein